MNKYESVIIVNPSLEEDAVKKLSDTFEALINKNGKVEKVDMLGKKKLAYEIKKNKEGSYVVFYFEANPTLIAELERNFRISDDVIKFMTINVTEKNND